MKPITKLLAVGLAAGDVLGVGVEVQPVPNFAVTPKALVASSPRITRRREILGRLEFLNLLPHKPAKFD
jgi:hypothetical protein